MENRKTVSGDAFLEELEGLRQGLLGGQPFRPNLVKDPTREKLAEIRRRRHMGGDDNHRFEGERYLNVPVKKIRREQLRKLIDEGGQDTVGGPMPSHTTLARWESEELGVSDEEITRLEKYQEPHPDRLLTLGWWVDMHRTAHWAVAIGSGLPGEGEKRIKALRGYYLQEIEELKKVYTSLGVKDLKRALAFKEEHASGTDVGHASFNAEVVKEYVNTPDTQDEMREVFLLRLHNKDF